MHRTFHILSLGMIVAAWLALLAAPLPAEAQNGGYGYVATLSFPASNNEGDWITLQDATQRLPRANGEQFSLPIPLGFDFYYFGETFRSIVVTSTGRVYFGRYIRGQEEMSIFPFADSLTLGHLGSVKTKVVQENAGRIFVCEFMQMSNEDSTTVFPWQLQLSEADMSIKFVLDPSRGVPYSLVRIGPTIQLNGRDGEALYVLVGQRTCQTVPFINQYYLDWYNGRVVHTITPVSYCWHPMGFTVSQATDTSLTVSWRLSESAARYVVFCGPEGAPPDTVVSTRQTAVTLTGLSPASAYEVGVYVVCTNGDGSDTVKCKTYTLCGDGVEDPFRYWDFYDTAVSCLYGTTHNPSVCRGVLDFGSSMDNSRHTVHSNPTEYDMRTNYMLKTVPDGYCYSVRLGNWLSGREQEEVVYRVKVDTNQYDLLMLRYAIVEQNPNHIPEVQPHFIFSICDTNGTLLDQCLYANFVAGDMSGWLDGIIGVVWHDWMSVGVDLAPYHGQEIQIHLNNADCVAGGHFGYAYYVLEKGSKRLSSTSCGDTVENTFTAPMGFSYRWYNAAIPSTTLSTSRQLHVTTAGNYCCRASYLHTGNSSCGFTLSARAGTRYPMSRFTMTPLNGCGTEVRFNNQSVVTTDWAHYYLTNEHCETYLWQFDDGTTSTLVNPTHTFVGEGVHAVTLTAMLAGGRCLDSYTDYVVVTYPHDTVYDTVCPGTLYQFHGYIVYDSGGHIVQDVCGPHWLNLAYHGTHATTLYDTICYGDTIWLGDIPMTDAGTYSMALPDVHGCDSMVTVDLTVHPAYSVRINDTLLVGEYLTAGSTRFYAPTVGAVRMQTLDGCDSTIEVTLSCIKQEDTTVCIGSLPVMWDSVIFTQEGTDTTFLKSRVMTDSLLVRTLHVRPTVDAGLRIVHSCDTPQHYIVMLSPEGLTYEWESSPAITLLGEETRDTLALLHFRPTAATQLIFRYGYVDPPACPEADTLTLMPPGYSYLRLDVQPETLTSDNLHLMARDLGRNAHFRRWIVDSVLQTGSAARMEYEASPLADSVVIVLIGGDSVCVDTARKTVPIIKEYLFCPNVFTPGQEENNRFRVMGPEMESFELWIYDRRGILMFHTVDREEGWDGTRKGIPCPQGTYAYICRYIVFGSQIRDQAGTVTLLR